MSISDDEEKTLLGTFSQINSKVYCLVLADKLYFAKNKWKKHRINKDTIGQYWDQVGKKNGIYDVDAGVESDILAYYMALVIIQK